MHAERRNSPRIDWSGRGIAMLGRSGRHEDCDIVNVGAGARIELKNDRLMPSEFDLIAEDLLTFHAKIVWRQHTAVGIIFDNAPYVGSDPKVVRLAPRT